ncbi:tetratricopeptide repeat protein [Singulisphaera sp. PoT]|uniref:tetratricopeptide repeat protein n=1 Tax=Singulisphaera sp. PoT TaxID=3411797 RepID=UPI003BF4AE3F
MHFSSLLGTIAPRSGLALTYVASATSREVALSMKTDDWGQLWINGERALSTAGGVYATPWTDKRRLDAGKSTFVSSVVNELGGHYLELQISDDPVDLARVEMNRGEWNTAEAHLTSALTASPSVPDDYRLRGDARALTSRWLDAASDFDQAASIRPDDPADRIRAAYTRLAAEDHARARELCRHLSAGPKLAETDPAFRDLHRLLAAVPGAISDGFPAIADVEKAEASKEALPMTGLHGAMLYRVGRLKAAAASLKHAIDAEKGKASATTWAYYALALAKLREPQPRVRETLDRAEALAKDERDALLDAARRDSSRWMELVALDSVLREARAVQPPTSQERRRPNPAALPR